MFHREHVELFAGDKILYKSVILLELLNVKMYAFARPFVRPSLYSQVTI
jgi:hypothetical protein